MNGVAKVVAAFVGVFIAGSVFGGFFAMRVAQEIQPRRQSGPPPPDITPQLISSYERQLQLTQDQKAKLQPIIARAGQTLNEIRETERKSTFAALDPLHKEIRSILTPEQIARLDDLERMQKDRGGRSFGGPNFGGRGGPPGSQGSRDGRGGSRGGPGGGSQRNGQSGGSTPQQAPAAPAQPAPASPAPAGS